MALKPIIADALVTEPAKLEKSFPNLFINRLTLRTHEGVQSLDVGVVPYNYETGEMLLKSEKRMRIADLSATISDKEASSVVDSLIELLIGMYKAQE